MRVECDRCGRLGPANLTASEAAIEHLCSYCGAISRHAVSAAGAPKVTFGRECPKCGNRPVTGDACVRCGLAVEHMEAFGRDSDQVSEALRAAWDASVEAWDDPATHDRVASLALTQEGYPWLARRYRAVLRERPGDTIASARLQRIGRMAEAALRATASPTAGAPARRGGAVAVLLVIMVVLAVGMVYAGRVLRDQRDDTTPMRVRAEPQKVPALPAGAPH